MSKQEENEHPIEKQPFRAASLIAAVQKETEYWMALLAACKDGETFLAAFKGVTRVFGALGHETSAMKHLDKAMQRHQEGDWAEARKQYASALSDLGHGRTDWGFAIRFLADDTPFDPYAPSKEEQEQHNVPPRASEMQKVSPYLLRIYRNMDRLLCMEQEIVQRQIACLEMSMQEMQD